MEGSVTRGQKRFTWFEPIPGPSGLRSTPQDTGKRFEYPVIQRYYSTDESESEEDYIAPKEKSTPLEGENFRFDEPPVKKELWRKK